MIRRLAAPALLLALAGCFPPLPTPEFGLMCRSRPPDRVFRTVRAEAVLLAPDDVFGDAPAGPSFDAAEWEPFAQCRLCAELIVERGFRAVEFAAPFQRDLQRVHRVSLAPVGDPRCTGLARATQVPGLNVESPPPPAGSCWVLELDQPRISIFAVTGRSEVAAPYTWRRTTELVNLTTREVLARYVRLHQGGGELHPVYCEEELAGSTSPDVRYVVTALTPGA